MRRARLESSLLIVRSTCTAIVLVVLLLGCDGTSELPTITAYPLMKRHDGASWTTLNPKEYTVDVLNQRVVYVLLDTVRRAENCVIKDVKNWQCTEDDGEWVFGFSEGEYVEKLSPRLREYMENISFERRYVSATRWWMIATMETLRIW